MQPTSPVISFSPDVEEYVTLNGYRRLDSSISPDTMVFIKDKQAIIFHIDTIQHKVSDEGYKDTVRVLFAWHTVHKYEGFDGKNMFQLMMLLDFMGAIRIKDINKELRSKINMANLIANLPGMYSQPQS